MIEQNTFNIIFGVFVLLTCRDIFYGHSSHQGESDVAKPAATIDSRIHRTGSMEPPIRANNPMEKPTIKILYCHSCGYRQAFEEISRMLLSAEPELRIEGDLHHPSLLRSQVVNLIFIAKIALLAMIYMDINPFTHFQLETPWIWNYMSQSKVSSSLFILFVANAIESNLMSTGAFEIFYNDFPIWSKITTGRMPSAPELLQIVSAQISIGRGIRPVVELAYMKD